MPQQRFVGIRSGWSGKGVIVFPVFQRVPGRAGKEVLLCGNVLGHIVRAKTSQASYIPYVHMGIDEIELDPDISDLDAAMAIMDYLSWRKDKRMECIDGTTYSEDR